MGNVVGKKGVRLFIQLHRIFLSCFGENPLDKAASVFRAIVKQIEGLPASGGLARRVSGGLACWPSHDRIIHMREIRVSRIEPKFIEYQWKKARPDPQSFDPNQRYRLIITYNFMSPIMGEVPKAHSQIRSVIRRANFELL
jgi:hypothetical protein